MRGGQGQPEQPSTGASRALGPVITRPSTNTGAAPSASQEGNRPMRSRIIRTFVAAAAAGATATTLGLAASGAASASVARPRPGRTISLSADRDDQLRPVTRPAGGTSATSAATHDRAGHLVPDRAVPVRSTSSCPTARSPSPAGTGNACTRAGIESVCRGPVVRRHAASPGSWVVVRRGVQQLAGRPVLPALLRTWPG